MAFPWGALLTSTLLFSFPNIHAADDSTDKYNKKGDIRKHRPLFKPTVWKQAHATFYEGGSETFGTISYLTSLLISKPLHSKNPNHKNKFIN